MEDKTSGIYKSFTKKDLQEFRLNRGLSLREVAANCSVSAQLIGQVENGERKITSYNFKEIIDGINKAFFTKHQKEAHKQHEVTSVEEKK